MKLIVINDLNIDIETFPLTFSHHNPVINHLPILSFLEIGNNRHNAVLFLHRQNRSENIRLITNLFDRFQNLLLCFFRYVAPIVQNTIDRAF